MGPNVEGNRRAAPMMTEDESMCRRVRLTDGLGPSEMSSTFVGRFNRLSHLLVK